MHNPQTQFRNLLAPITPEVFFQDYLGQKALYIPGNRDKFEGLFDWADLNQIINLGHIWNANTFKLILDNEQIPSTVYMPQGILNVKEVSTYINKGASVVLSGMETYCEGSAALAASLQAAIGGLSRCNLYCSFKKHPGFLPHFDLMDVYVFQIDGEKDWEIFETHFENPMLKPGCHQMSFTREQHAINKGRVEKRLTMKPGDILYLPKGKYHTAIASSDHSLHLTYGMEPPRALHFIETIVQSLYMDAAFRQEMPHYDDIAAYDKIINKIADKLHARITSDEAKTRIRHEHSQLSLLNITRFDLPNQMLVQNFRVRTTGTRIKRRSKSWQLSIDNKDMVISPDNAPLIEWMLTSELFSRSDLLAAFPAQSEKNADTLLKLLQEFRLLIEF
jgi:ribosomal protein L16 Arg81 hydroxylase